MSSTDSTLEGVGPLVTDWVAKVCCFSSQKQGKNSWFSWALVKSQLYKKDSYYTHKVLQWQDIPVCPQHTAGMLPHPTGFQNPLEASQRTHCKDTLKYFPLCGHTQGGWLTTGWWKSPLLKLNSDSFVAEHRQDVRAQDKQCCPIISQAQRRREMGEPTTIKHCCTPARMQNTQHTLACVTAEFTHFLGGSSSSWNSFSSFTSTLISFCLSFSSFPLLAFLLCFGASLQRHKYNTLLQYSSHCLLFTKI